ncbi:MAG: GGDEF domain-containing protein [Firmicutes bacterium]|nr:GGDEF domain-containing protein [Candidatus Fiminaster equi]
MEKKEKRKIIEIIKDLLLDKQKYEKLVKLASYAVLFSVLVVMTIMNVFKLSDTSQNYALLTYTTGSMAVLLLINFVVTLFSRLGTKICAGLFAFELVGMFAIFLVTGVPDGFSALWIALLPITSMIFFGRMWGSIISGFMFIVLILCFWTPVGHYIIQYNGYGATFKTRFPVLYLAFFAVAFILETIQIYQFSALEKINRINEGYSTHDGLTGLFNRKGFYDLLEIELKKKTYNKIGFIIFDLDFFKKLNDTYGHVAGDEVLIEFAKLIEEKLSNSLATCRWGGEEFLVCYVDDQIKKADLDEFKKEIEKHEFVSDDQIMKTTVSGGVFETNDKDFDNHKEWLKNADTALYKAKETGRNKIVYF